MRPPQPALIKKLTRYIASFVLGIIAGSIIFLYIHGQQLENVLLENRQLHSENKILKEDLQAEVKENEEISKQNQQKLLVKKIDVKIVHKDDDPPDGFTASDVSDLLREDLKFLISQPLESVAETHETLYSLIERYTYEINQQRIGLKVEALTIYTTITVNVRIQKLP